MGCDETPATAIALKATASGAARRAAMAHAPAHFLAADEIASRQPAGGDLRRRSKAFEKLKIEELEKKLTSSLPRS